jgi:Tol biopolymer transport system component
LIYADARGDDFVLRMYSFADKSSARFSDVASRVDPPSAAFAPDGRWVAYTSRDGTERKLCVEPVPPTGAKHLIATTAWHPVWSADGKSLFFRVGGTGLHVAHLTTAPAFVVSNPQPIPSGQWRSLGRVEREYDVTPDGRRILVLIQSGGPESLTSGIRINVVLNWFEELKRRVPTH